MLIIYIVLGLTAAIMLSGAVCSVFKCGEKENICKYDHAEEGEN